MNNITANFNNLWGASLDALDVNISDSKFNNNVTQSHVFIDDTGLIINSQGSVNLFNVEAKENRLTGADIKAVGLVFIGSSVFSDNQGTTCSDHWCKNVTYHGYGLKVVTLDSIFLSDVTANNNNLFGAYLEGASVTISDSTFDENGSGDNKNPTGKGLEVVSTGDVTLNNVSASHNELFGANIQTDGNVEINNSFFSNNVFYTSGWCKGTTYDGYGLKVVTTTGNITLNTVTANDNGLYGASLDGTLDINVSDSTFNNNITSSGLIITGGNVTLNNVTASNNGADGVTICKADSVEVNNSTFADNDEYGLKVASPVFSESGNTYLNNGSGSLFYNPTSCVTTNGNHNGNSNHNTWWWKNWWKNYQGHQFGNSYHGGSSHKSCHSYGKKW
jgi:hypothetical protein